MKKMMLIMIPLLLGLLTYSQAQDCEEYLKKDVSNYTDSKMIETIWIEAAKDQAYLKFSLKSRKIEIDYSSNSKEVSEKNDTIVFKFENGKEIQMIAPRKGSDIFSYTDGISTKWQNTYLGNLEFLDNLSANKLLNIVEKRTGLNIELKDKYAKTLTEGASCFYSQIDTLNDIQPYYLERNSSECDFFEYKVDNFSGDIRKRVTYTTIGFKGQSNDYNSFALVGSLFDFGSGLGLDIRLNSSSYCTNDNSYIMIKLDNDEIIKINSSSGIDCGEGTTFKCYLKEENVSKLKELQIKVIRLMTADGFIDIENITYPQYFMDQLKCLTK